jgi:hypothetical protein
LSIRKTRSEENPSADVEVMILSDFRVRRRGVGPAKKATALGKFRLLFSIL